jgi:hypothetical protein
LLLFIVVFIIVANPVMAALPIADLPRHQATPVRRDDGDG